MSQFRLKAVAFDAVGTLIEPVPSVAQAYRLAAQRVGLELPAELIKSRFYQAFQNDDHLPDHATDEANEQSRWRQIVAHCLPELSSEKSDQVFASLWQHFADPSNWRLFDEVPYVLDLLHEKGVRLCVASNFDSRLRQVWAGLEGVRQLDRHLIISSEVGCRKPGQKFYEAVGKHLECQFDEILFVGDDWVNDVEVPMKFGFETVLIDRHGRMNKKESMKNLEAILPLLASSC